MADFEVFEHFMGHEEKNHEGDTNTTYAYLKSRLDEGRSFNCLEVRDVALDDTLPATEWFTTAQEAMIQHVVYEAMMLLGSPRHRRPAVEAMQATKKIMEILR